MDKAKVPDLQVVKRYIEALAGTSTRPVTWVVGIDGTHSALRLHGCLDDLWTTLCEANAAGKGVFVCVNETNGMGRKKQDIRAVRAVFIDVDGGVQPKNFHLPPSIVVHTPNGLHAYWVVDDCKLGDFQAAQQALIARYRSDKAVTDLPRLMRVPGFNHCKAEPRPVVLMEAEPARRYHLSQVLEGLQPPPPSTPAPAVAAASPAPDLLSAFQERGWYRRALDEGKHAVVCPWVDSHSQPDPDLKSPDTSTVLLPSNRDGALFFKCSHGHCAERTRMDVEQALGLKPRFLLREGGEHEAAEFCATRLVALGALQGATLLLGTVGKGLVSLTEERVKLELPKWVQFERSNQKGQRRPATLTNDIVRMALTRLGDTAPKLHGRASAPFLRPDGTICTTPGFDPATGTWGEFVPEAWPDLGRTGTREEAIEAVETLRELVTDFGFATEADQSAWLAALLTAAARRAIDGPTPMFVIHANTPGVGKSKLVDLISLVIRGRHAERESPALSEAELEKRVTSGLRDGVELWLFDNMDRPIGNSTLDALLTGNSFSGRVLGASERYTAKLQLTWFATGNNVSFGSDFQRRVVPIRLSTPDAHPEERTGFRYANIEKHVQENRRKLYGLTVQILHTYLNQPERPALKPLGSFEAWGEVVRGALVWLGFPDPVDARDEMLADPDRHCGPPMEQLLLAIRETFVERFTASSVADRFREAPNSTLALILQEHKPPESSEWTAAAIAQLFRKHRDRWHGDIRICRFNEDATRSNKGALWRIERR